MTKTFDYEETYEAIMDEAHKLDCADEDIEVLDNYSSYKAYFNSCIECIMDAIYAKYEIPEEYKETLKNDIINDYDPSVFGQFSREDWEDYTETDYCESDWEEYGYVG